MHDLGKLLRCPNINRHNSLMSSAAVCVDLRHFILKSQVESVFGIFLVASVIDFDHRSMLMNNFMLILLPPSHTCFGLF